MEGLFKARERFTLQDTNNTASPIGDAKRKDGRALKSNSAALRDAARRHANLVAWQTDGHGGAFQSTRKVLTLQDTKNTASPIGDAVFLARPEE